MSQDCPDCASQARSGKVKEETTQGTKEESAEIKQVMVEQLVSLVRNMSPEEKDKVIQDIFIKDF